MAIWAQHLLVILLVVACACIVGRQIVASLRGKQSRVGSCCAKGCSEVAKEQEAKAKTTERVVFLPVEFLGSSRKK